MKKFTLFFSWINNSHLTKDVGLIPFVMQKYCGYKSSILIPKTDNEYPDAKKYLDNLQINFYESNEDIAMYLQDVDVLMLIGIYEFNLPVINYYRSIKPEGKIYLKLDASMYWMQNLNQVMNEDVIDILKKCDLITAESKKVSSYINSVWGLNVKYYTNGYYEYFEDENISYEDKENIIMFAGVIGSQVKANHILLEAFKNVENKIGNWKLVLAGNVEEEFLPYLNNYLNENPSIKDKIILPGRLEKPKLKKLYQKAKVFCLTSVSEGSPNVLPEAIYNGCYFVSTDVGCVFEVIENGKYGSVFPINDIKSLENILALLCNDEDKLKENCEQSQKYARENLNWIDICKEIKKELEK